MGWQGYGDALASGILSTATSQVDTILKPKIYRLLVRERNLQFLHYSYYRLLTNVCFLQIAHVHTPILQLLSKRKSTFGFADKVYCSVTVASCSVAAGSAAAASCSVAVGRAAAASCSTTADSAAAASGSAAAASCSMVAGSHYHAQ
jgi:hypothetical protein